MSEEKADSAKPALTQTAYSVTLAYKQDLHEQTTSIVFSSNCPNCGAPLEISSSGVCEYCGSVVTTGQYSWVLTDFSGIRNDTVDDGIKGV